MFQGRPHLFESCWNDIETEQEPVYLLSPISRDLLAAVIEDWEIWLRWSKARKAGEVTDGEPRALPVDRVRYAELAELLKVELKIDENNKTAATASFSFANDLESSIEAEWTIVELDAGNDKRDRYRDE